MFDENFSVALGLYTPEKTCLSLPYKGVNMSFKSESVYGIWFPQHSMHKRALSNEQYFGLQSFLKGYDMIYIPSARQCLM